LCHALANIANSFSECWIQVGSTREFPGLSQRARFRRLFSVSRLDLPSESVHQPRHPPASGGLLSTRSESTWPLRSEGTIARLSHCERVKSRRPTQRATWDGERGRPARLKWPSASSLNAIVRSERHMARSLGARDIATRSCLACEAHTVSARGKAIRDGADGDAPRALLAANAERVRARRSPCSYWAAPSNHGSYEGISR
jgi:hypothetical protein